MVHTLRLDNYYPTPRKLVLGTNSSFGTESIKIERGAGWDGLNLTATWHIPGREEPLRVALLDGDAMDVPPEVTKEAKDGVLVLAGLASGVQRASCNVEYLILEQAGVYGGADAEPTPELAAQVLEAVLQAKADAKAAAEDAAAAKANADKAQQAAENAAADAAKAGPYAEAARAAQEAAESARDKAIAAQQAAENAAAAAAASKSAADTLAAEAARAAQAAENSKAAANNAANLAGENATAAQQAADTATAAANDAGQSASDAAASKAAAETAAKAAQDAQTAAAEAKAEAVKAQEAAETAAKSAQDAQAAAEKARDEAKAAQKGAEAARDTAAKSAEAAAKSEANAKQSADTLAESVENVVANTAAVAELKQQVKNITPDDSSIGDKPWSSKHIIDMLCPPLEESGNPVVCYPVAGYPLDVTAKWEPVQEGSGTPSHENIRPIKGRDSVTVERCGENLLPFGERIENIYTQQIMTSDDLLLLSKACAGQEVTLTFTVETQNIVFEDVVEDVWRKRIGFECHGTSADGAEAYVLQCWLYDVDSELPKNGKKTKTVTVTMPKLVSGTIMFYAQNIKSGSFVAYDFGIYAGTTAPTTYSPYNGQTNTLTLPETVYGGEVDAVTGEGRKTWGTETISKIASINELTSVVRCAATLSQKSVTAKSGSAISNWLGEYVSYAEDKESFYTNQMQIYIKISKTRLSSLNVAGVNAYLSEHPLTVCYKLAEPVPFTATGAQPIPALAGANTVLTDADSATVTGRADPIKRITDLEAAVASIN